MRLRRWVVVGLLLGLLGGLLPVSPVGGQVSGRAVSGVSVSGGGAGVVVVSWAAPVEAPVDYRVMWARADLEFLSYRYEDEAERGNLYPAGGETSVRLEGLAPGADYKAVVRARYGPGNQGPWSGQSSGAAGQLDDSSDDDSSDGGGDSQNDDGDGRNNGRSDGGDSQDDGGGGSVGAGTVSDVAAATADVVGVLVSNAAQTAHHTEVAHAVLSQGFTAGSHGPGYGLVGVDIASPSVRGYDITAAVWVLGDDGDHGDKVADLALASSTAAGRITFAAPAGTELAAGGDYAVVLSLISGRRGFYDTTDSHSEDRAAAGWDIADGFRHKHSAEGDWHDHGRSLRIAIRGALVVLADTPSGVSVSGDGAGVAVVSWTAPAEAPVDYRVMWARADLEFLSHRNADEADRGNSYPAGGETSVRLEGLTPGTEYKAVVRARYGPDNQGPWSDHASGAAGQPDNSPDDDNSEDDGDGDGQDDGDDGGGPVDGGITHGDGDGFDLVGVMSVASAWVGDQEVLGYSLRGGGVGSFATTSVGDEQYAGHVGGRGFLNGLMRVPGRYEISRVGEYDDALVLMTQFGLASPFLLEVGGRLYSSASASALNVRGYSDKFWVWEDPCARWAENQEVAVSFDDGADSAAELRSADASLASLELAGAELGQEFTAETLDYSATAGDGVSQVTIDAAVADANACSVEISPADADPDTAGHQIDVDAEDGAAATVAVTAGDGSTAAVYTVTVSAPGGALPAAAASMGLDGIPGLGFDPDQRRYDTVVPPGTTSTTVRVRTAPGTTVDTTAYRAPPPPAPVAPRAPKSSLVRSSQPPASTSGGGPQQEEVGSDGRVELPPGRDTVVAVKTSTEDYERERIYTARLRPAPASRTRSTRTTGPVLSGLSVDPGELSPAFSADTRQYTVTVTHFTQHITIAATAAAGTTATVTAPDADTAAPGHQVALNASEANSSTQTAVLVTVTRGTEIDTYTLTVNRKSIHPPRIRGLSIAHATWTERGYFLAGDSTHSVEVNREHSQVTVTPTTRPGVTATFSVADADPNTPGHQISLPEPIFHYNTSSKFTLTAANEADSFEYTIVIWRRWWSTGSEPPGTDFNRTTTGRVQVGGSVNGTIPSGGDTSDWFAVDLAAGQRYVIDLAAWCYEYTPSAYFEDWLDPSRPVSYCRKQDAIIRQIVDSEGNVQPNTYNDDWGLDYSDRITADSRVYITPATAGTYYIEVSTGDRYRDRYRLSVNTTDEVDIPADTSSTARVATDAEYVGVIHHASDTDWVGMELQAGVKYKITATTTSVHSQETGTPRGIGRLGNLAIMDASGNRVASSWGPWPYEKVTVTFTPATAGTYFVQIRGRTRVWLHARDPRSSGVYIVSFEETS